MTSFLEPATVASSSLSFNLPQSHLRLELHFDSVDYAGILPYLPHHSTYLCLSWASITYTYEDIYTRVGRHHEGGLRAGTQVLEEAGGLSLYKGVTIC